MLIIGISLVILLVLGVPVSFAVGAVSIAGAILLTDIPGAEIFAGMIESLCDPLLLAVPLFILAANLMNEGKATDRLIDVGTALLGHRRGGLAYVNILVSMIFAGVTGSSQEDTVSVGKNMIPSMIRQGYDRKTAVGLLDNRLCDSAQCIDGGLFHTGACGHSRALSLRPAAGNPAGPFYDGCCMDSEQKKTVSLR